jgi:hypothetical protein
MLQVRAIKLAFLCELTFEGATVDEVDLVVDEKRCKEFLVGFNQSSQTGLMSRGLSHQHQRRSQMQLGAGPLAMKETRD